MSIDEWMMLLETALEADGRHHDVERGFRMAFTMSQAFVVDEVAGVDHMTMEQPEFYEAVRVWTWLVVSMALAAQLRFTCAAVSCNSLLVWPCCSATTTWISPCACGWSTWS